jgi:TDG/mug DNA glycosylase family protein
LHVVPVSKPKPKPLPDVLGPGIRVLFAGINPSLYSAERGHHYAGPGNRFWPALHGSGFTPRLFTPYEDGELPALGIGLTNVCARPTRAAAELTDDELREGAKELDDLARAVAPEVVAVVGFGAFRVGWGVKTATAGPQDTTVGGVPAWVLPNPSGLNAHYPPARLVEEFARLKEHLG